MDRIQELLTRLADLSDAEIAELEGLILSEFDSVEAEEPTNDSVERMVSLADALDSVRCRGGSPQRPRRGALRRRPPRLPRASTLMRPLTHLPSPRWPLRTRRKRRRGASLRGPDRRGHRAGDRGRGRGRRRRRGRRRGARRGEEDDEDEDKLSSETAPEAELSETPAPEAELSEEDNSTRPRPTPSCQPTARPQRPQPKQASRRTR